MPRDADYKADSLFFIGSTDVRRLVHKVPGIADQRVRLPGIHLGSFLLREEWVEVDLCYIQGDVALGVWSGHHREP